MSTPHLTVVTDDNTPTVDDLYREILRDYKVAAVSVTATAFEAGYTVTLIWPQPDSTVNIPGFNTPLEALLHVKRVLVEAKAKREAVTR